MKLFQKGFKEQITKYKVFESAIEELSQKSSVVRRMDELVTDDIKVRDIIFNSKSFSISLAKDIKSFSYTPSKAEVYTIDTDGKERKIYKFNFIDSVIIKSLSNIINSLMEPSYSENLYSYRSGMSWWKPMYNFSKFYKEKNKNREKKEKGLYVLQMDIKSYTDDIPVHEESPLWTMLYEVLKLKREDSYYKSLIKKLIRPCLIENDIEYSNLYGIPTGQSITASIYNFYCHHLDSMYEDFKDSFYVRYSDDILFSSTDRDSVIDFYKRFEVKLNSLELSLKKQKVNLVYLNGPGKDCDSSNFIGQSFIEHLGCRVNGKGQIGLKKSKLRKMLTIIKRLITRVDSISNENLSVNERGKIICNAINELLKTRMNHKEDKIFSTMKLIMNDRSQLKNIDFMIASLVLKKIYGTQTVKNFRKTSYQEMRSDWNLVSLNQYRNRHG